MLPSPAAIDGVVPKNGPLRRLRHKGQSFHQRIPLLKTLPFSAVAIITFLIFVNMAVWAVVGVILVSQCLTWPIHDLTEFLSELPQVSRFFGSFVLCAWSSPRF